MSRLVRAAANRNADAPALEDGNGTRFSYGELDRAVEAVASRLAEHGARHGDTVALLTRARVDQVVWVHAAWRLGCVVAPLHPTSSTAEIAAAFGAVNPRLVVAEPDTADRIGTPDVETVDGDALSEPLLGKARGEPLFSVESAGGRVDGRAAVLWTSGTSGHPRGVALGWRGLLFNAEASRQRLGLSAADRWYASLSIAHVGGLVLVARAAALGSSVVLPGRFSVEDFQRLSSSSRITHASLVPAMLRRILDAGGDARAPEGLRVLLIGGAAAPPALIERAHRSGYPVAPTYGMSETSSQVATASPRESRIRPDSVGKVLPGAELRIGEGGEILVRGPLLAEGYVGIEDALVDGDGWLHTGDRGELGREGTLRVSGRVSDRIITGGFNVDPAEVEAVLRSLPWVSDACVVGIADPVWGERLVALVSALSDGVSTAGGSPSERPDRADFRAALSDSLRPEKHPKTYHWVEAVPRNRMGKVDRARARVLAEDLEP